MSRVVSTTSCEDALGDRLGTFNGTGRCDEIKIDKPLDLDFWEGLNQIDSLGHGNHQRRISEVYVL